MQTKRHETDILKRLQPGLVHKNILHEQKTGSRRPLTQNKYTVALGIPLTMHHL